MLPNAIPPMKGIEPSPEPKALGKASCPITALVRNEINKGSVKGKASQALAAYIIYEGTKKKLGIDTSKAPPEIAMIVGATAGLTTGEALAIARYPIETYKTFAPEILGASAGKAHVSPGTFIKVLTKVPPEHLIRGFIEATHSPSAVFPVIAGACYEGGKAYASAYFQEKEEGSSKEPEKVNAYDPISGEIREQEKSKAEEIPSHSPSGRASSPADSTKLNPSLIHAIFDGAVTDVDSDGESDSASSSDKPSAPNADSSSSQQLSNSLSDEPAKQDTLPEPVGAGSPTEPAKEDQSIALASSVDLFI